MAQFKVLKGAGAQFPSHKWEERVPSDELPAVVATSNATHSSLDIEEEKKVARDEGFAAGEAAARKGYEAAIQSANRELAKSVADISQLRGQVIFQARKDLLQLSLEIARRVIHRELHIAPGVLGGIVSALLDTLATRDVLRVRVHPSQVAKVEAELRRISRGEADPPITPDASLPVGGCIIDSVSGEIDAGIDSQLSEIERGLSDMLGAAS